MMRMRRFSFADLYTLIIVIVGVAAGCSPRVTSDVMTYEFKPVPTNKVMIVGKTDSIFERVRTIGQLTVDGKSVSVSREYGRVLSMAVCETARNGGNVLVVDHSALKENRLKGMIANTECDVIDSLTLSAKRLQQLQATITGHRQAAQAAVVRQQEESSTPSVDAWAIENTVGYPVRPTDSPTAIKEESSKRSGMLKISAGPMWTTSKLYYDNSGHYVSGKCGFGLALSLSSIGSKSFGLGADFYVSHTQIDVPQLPSYEDCSYTMGYVGPCVLYQAAITDRFLIETSLGSGLAYYHDVGQSEFGFGIRASAGLEYMVTKSVGIGVDLLRQTSRYSRPNGFNQPKGEGYGVEHLGVMASAKIHW